eukprot:347972_1
MFRSQFLKSYESLNEGLQQTIKALGIPVWKSNCKSTVLNVLQTFIMDNERLVMTKHLKTYSIQLMCVEIIHQLTIKYVLSMEEVKELIINHSATPSIAVKYTNTKIRNIYLNKIPSMTFNLPYVEDNSLLTKPYYNTYVTLSTAPSWEVNYMTHVIDFFVHKLQLENIHKIQHINNVLDVSKHLLNYNTDLNNNMGVYSIKTILESAGVSDKSFLSELTVRKNSKQISLKHNMIQEELNKINHDTEKYRAMVGAKLRQELVNYHVALKLLENKNTAHANDNSLMINELEKQNYKFLISKLIFNLWIDKIQNRREQMMKYRDKNKLFIIANKQNSGGKGADLFGVPEAQRFANAMLTRSFDGLIKVCSRRKDCSIKFTGDKNTNNTLYLGFIIYAAICIQEQKELGSIDHKHAVQLLGQYEKDKITLNYSATIQMRWKSKDALKWYNDRGNSKTIHSLKIKIGPSVGLWKSQLL